MSSFIKSILGQNDNDKQDDDDLTKTLNIISMEELSSSSPTILGESPFFCAVTQTLIYVDINGKRILVYDPSSKSTTSMQMSQLVAFAIPTSETRKRHDGTMLYLLVGLEDRIVEVNFTEQKIIRTIVEIPIDIKDTNSRFNDAKASPDGVLYCGYMHLKWREGNGGHFFKMKNDGSNALQTLLKPIEIGLPNGLAWVSKNSKESSNMYIVDSMKNTITMYNAIDNQPNVKDSEPFGVSTSKEIACCAETNDYTFDEVSVIYSLEDEYINAGGVLDGMTIDSEGKLWVAVSGCSCILRIDPITRKVCYKLITPITKPTALTFGGRNLELLYITSRNEDASNEPQALLYCCQIEGIKGMSAGNQVTISRKEFSCCSLPDYLNPLTIKF